MTPLEKNKRFWSLVIFISLSIGIIWVLVGVFSMLLGFNTCLAQNWGYLGGTDATEYITSVEHYYEVLWLFNFSASTIPCIDNGGSLYSQERWWWSGTEWLSVGSTSASPNGCVNGYIDPAVMIMVSDSELTTYGIGYYIIETWHGGTCCEDANYVRAYWNGVEITLVEGEVEPRVWASAPASETEITDLEQNITVNWEGLGNYDVLYLTFIYPSLGIPTDAKTYDIVEIGGAGDMDIPLIDFNFTKNGNWYLKSIASYEGYIIQGGMFLSGYGAQFTGDLTDGEYYLNINIEGFESVFVMGDFSGWYSENVDRFNEPTEAFFSLAQLLSPMFSYIGEFGNKITEYFNSDEAYSRGYEVGRSIPVFSYYLGQVKVFLGGFPFMSTFFVILLIMVGIFLFRLVIRFIPHFGG